MASAYGHRPPYGAQGYDRPRQPPYRPQPGANPGPAWSGDGGLSYNRAGPGANFGPSPPRQPHAPRPRQGPPPPQPAPYNSRGPSSQNAPYGPPRQRRDDPRYGPQYHDQSTYDQGAWYGDQYSGQEYDYSYNDQQQWSDWHHDNGHYEDPAYAHGDNGYYNQPGPPYQDPAPRQQAGESYDRTSPQQHRGHNDHWQASQRPPPQRSHSDMGPASQPQQPPQSISPLSQANQGTAKPQSHPRHAKPRDLEGTPKKKSRDRILKQPDSPETLPWDNPFPVFPSTERKKMAKVEANPDRPSSAPGHRPGEKGADTSTPRSAGPTQTHFPGSTLPPDRAGKHLAPPDNPPMRRSDELPRRPQVNTQPSSAGSYQQSDAERSRTLPNDLANRVAQAYGPPQPESNYARQGPPHRNYPEQQGPLPIRQHPQQQGRSHSFDDAGPVHGNNAPPRPVLNPLQQSHGPALQPQQGYFQHVNTAGTGATPGEEDMPKFGHAPESNKNGNSELHIGPTAQRSRSQPEIRPAQGHSNAQTGPGYDSIASPMSAHADPGHQWDHYPAGHANGHPPVPAWEQRNGSSTAPWQQNPSRVGGYGNQGPMPTRGPPEWRGPEQGPRMHSRSDQRGPTPNHGGYSNFEQEQAYQQGTPHSRPVAQGSSPSSTSGPSPDRRRHLNGSPGSALSPHAAGRPSPAVSPQQYNSSNFSHSANPDALPEHPAPVRPGLQGSGSGTSSRPAPVRQYQSTTPSESQATPPPLIAQAQPPPTQVVTPQALQELRAAVQRHPHDQSQQLALAKKLVEASSVLAGEGGRADAKTKAKNRERYSSEAQKLLKKLVSHGHADSQFYFADCLGTGVLGLASDPKEAFNLYQSAAKSGHAQAAYRAAVCCEMGHEENGGTKRDPIKAMQFYHRAASNGDTPAMYKLGMIQLKGLLGQTRNPREAMTWLQRAADRADAENPHAVHELALLYESANGNSGITRDEAHARQLFQRGSELGYKFSQNRLGAAYEYGQLGCTIDPKRSIYYYSKAATQDEPQASLALSGWYLTGSEGIIQQNDTEAYLWARKAATSGLAKAEYALGYYTEVGIGTTADLEGAKRWYWKSASQGYPKAKERLEDLRRGGGRIQKTRVSRSAVNKSEGDCRIM